MGVKAGRRLFAIIDRKCQFANELGSTLHQGRLNNTEELMGWISK
jgi:hypothetical protein